MVSTYNSAEFIRNRIDNLLEQTVDGLQIWVLDANSTQDEDKIVASFKNDPRTIRTNITYYKAPTRLSLYEAWNYILHNSNSTYVVNANTDDINHPDYYKEAIELLESGPYDMVYSPWYCTKIPNQSWPPYNTYRIDNSDIGTVCSHSPVWRRSLHIQYGVFDERFICVGDCEWWERLYHYKAKLAKLKWPMICWLDRGQNNLFLAARDKEGGVAWESEVALRRTSIRYPVLGASIRTPKILHIPADQIVSTIQSPQSYKIISLLSIYNGAAHLRNCIDNLLDQTIDNHQIWIYDAHSPGDEYKIIQSFHNDIRTKRTHIYYYKSPTRTTLYQAWNYILCHSNSKYIANPNVSDITDPNYYKEAIELLENGPYDLIHTSWYNTLVANQSWPPKHTCYTHNNPLCTTLGHNQVWKRELHHKYGYFDEQFTCMGDAEWWKRLTHYSSKFHKIDTPMVCWLNGSNNLYLSARDKNGDLATDVETQLLQSINYKSPTPQIISRPPPLPPPLPPPRIKHRTVLTNKAKAIAHHHIIYKPANKHQ